MQLYPLKQMPLLLCNHEIEKEQLLLTLILMYRFTSIKHYRKEHVLVIIRNHQNIYLQLLLLYNDATYDFANTSIINILFEVLIKKICVVKIISVLGASLYFITLFVL